MAATATTPCSAARGTTSCSATRATATISGNDVVITADDNDDGDPNDFGMVLVQNLVTDLGLQQLLGNPFFDEAALIDFLIRGDADGNEKGIIVFEDKCIDEMPFVVDKPVVDCPEPVYVPQPKFVPLDTKNIGDTIINTTEAEVAGLALQQDDDVDIEQGVIVVNCCTELDVTAA